MTPGALSDRTRRVLACLVKDYIDSGEPVASATLSRRAGLACVAGHHPQRAGPARGHGLRQPAPHVGRPRAHRPRLPLLRRHAARDAPRRPATPPPSKRGCASRPAQAPLFDQLLSSASHVLFEVSHHVGFAIAPSDMHAIFQRIEFVPLSTLARAGRDGGARQPRLAEGHRPRRADRAERPHAGRQLPQCRVRRPARSTKCARPCWRGWSRNAPSTTSCGPSRSSSRARTLEGIESPTIVFIDGASSLADDAEDASAVSLSTLRTLLRMVEEKQRLVRLLDAYLDGPGVAVVIGAEHPDPATARLQPRRRHLRRRRAPRRRGRHRADSHALLPRHQRRRRRGRRRGAFPARPELARSAPPGLFTP